MENIINDRWYRITRIRIQGMTHNVSYYFDTNEIIRQYNNFISVKNAKETYSLVTRSFQETYNKVSRRLAMVFSIIWDHWCFGGTWMVCRKNIKLAT
jgi:hypothetical protein